MKTTTRNWFSKPKFTPGLLVLILVWVVLFLSPVMFMGMSEGFCLKQFLFDLAIPTSLFITFLANFYWLTPRVLMHGKTWRFSLYNALLIGALAFLMHEWMSFSADTWYPEIYVIRTKRILGLHGTTDTDIIFALRDIFNMAVAAVVATAIRFSLNWNKMHEREQEIEIEKTAMELKLLQYQINPHFLLNTMNNIYALTAIDTAKAQEAILSLSKLMRRLLYNKQANLPMREEVDFIKSYIALMAMRLTPNVEVKANYHIEGHENKQVASMIMLPLIENSFKHGVCTTRPSFIHIDISATDTTIGCCIENSNYPKDSHDHSGHGIGLQHVKRRLEMSYPGRYTWERGVDTATNTYTSKLTIYDS